MKKNEREILNEIAEKEFNETDRKTILERINEEIDKLPQKSSVKRRKPSAWIWASCSCFLVLIIALGIIVPKIIESNITFHTGDMVERAIDSDSVNILCGSELKIEGYEIQNARAYFAKTDLDKPVYLTIEYASTSDEKPISDVIELNLFLVMNYEYDLDAMYDNQLLIKAANVDGVKLPYYEEFDTEMSITKLRTKFIIGQRTYYIQAECFAMTTSAEELIIRIYKSF